MTIATIQFQNISITPSDSPCLSLIIPTPKQSEMCFLSLKNCLFWTLHLNSIIQYWIFHVRLLWLTMFFRLIRAVMHISSLFPFIAKQYCIVWLYYILFIHSSADGCLQFFQFGDVMYNASMNMSLCQHSLSFLLGRYVGVELLSCIINLCLTF